MSTAINTADGIITSRRIAWTTPSGRNVWVWRTDRGEAPLDFGTPDDARAWIDYLLIGGTPPERRELGAWTIVDAVTS